MFKLTHLAGFGGRGVSGFSVNADGAGTDENTNTATFSALSAANPSPDRYILVTLAARDNASDATLSLSVTIDGNTATEILLNVVAANGHTTAIGFYYVALPTGTSFDVVATMTGFSATMRWWSCQVYEVEGADLSSCLTATGTGDVTIDPTGYEAVLAVAADEGGTDGAWSGGNMTEDYDGASAGEVISHGSDLTPPATSTVYDHSDFDHNHAAIAIPAGTTP